VNLGSNVKFSKNIIASLMFATSSAFSQTRWVAPAADSLGVRLGIVSPVLFSDIKDSKPVGAGTPITFEPSLASKTALTLFYSHFSLTGSVGNKINDLDAANKGASRAEDYQFRFYYKYGTWDLLYQNYQGYFIKNSQEIDPSFSSDLKIQRPDIKMAHRGIQYFYLLSPDKYSLGGTFDQNIRQTESGGSAILSAFLGSHRVNADSPLVPSQVAAGYGSFANFKDGEFQSARVGLGYGYTAVFYKFYVGFLFGLSLGLQQQRFDLITEIYDRWVSATGTNVKIGFGYNGEKFFSGFQYIMDNTAFGFNEYTLGLTSGEFRFFVGTRFEGIKIPPVTWLGESLYGN
jgi:hypothetical protein